MPKTINEYFQPSSTSSHSNIDNLILQAELDKFAQTGSMREDKTPRYIGGTDDVVANIALSPILTLKSMGNVGRKILEKTGLRNPVSHHTTGQGATNILDKGSIYGTGKFPGKNLIGGTRAVSVTRDPMFTSRPHGSIGTDIRFVLDRDEMVKKGFTMKPIAVGGYEKTSPYDISRLIHKDIYGKYPPQMNPKFEFEERVRGNIPSENIKLIDLLNFPQGAGKRSEAYDIINTLGKTDIPIIRNPKTTEQIETMAKMFSKYGMERIPSSVIEERLNNLLSAPTYKFDPFKR